MLQHSDDVIKGENYTEMIRDYLISTYVKISGKLTSLNSGKLTHLIKKTRFSYKQNFISNTRLKLTKNQEKAKQATP